MDYDALTGKGSEAETESMAGKRKKSLIVRSRTQDNYCCRRKCFIATVIGLFLFVTFVSIPAGAFLIIYGDRKGLMGFKVGGAMVVSIPIVVAFVFCIILCVRRKSSRKLTLNSSAAHI